MQVDNGRKILNDWLGLGALPVSVEQAQNRADVCTGILNGHPCPNNVPGLRPLAFVAEIIKTHVGEKNRHELAVAGEKDLHTCSVCYCHLPLKIFVPLNTIMNRTPPEIIETFRLQKPDCWLITELANQQPE